MGFFEFLFGKPKTYQHTERAALGSGNRSLSTSTTRRRPEASILNVQVGGVISYNATDFVVRNRYVYEDHGFEWFSFHLVDTISGQKLWIDAEDDDELSVALSQPVKMDISLPMQSKLFHNGISFYQDEHGYAKVLIESEDSEPHYSQVEFWDFYDEEDEQFLGIERWGNELEVSVGHYIEPFELSILSTGDPHA